MDVVLVGAGPNGLMLACELALAGVRPLVLERAPGPTDEQKASGLVGQVIRALDIRGLYRALTGDPGPPRPVPSHVFAGMALSLVDVPDNPMYAVPIAQPQLVRVLCERARDLGVEIRWGHELTDMDPNVEGVALTVATPERSYRLVARYLVGADGGRSMIRKRAGIGFPGVTTPMHARHASIHVPDDLRRDWGWEVPGFGRIPFGINRFDGGVIFYVERSPGQSTVATMEFDDTPVNETEPLTIQEVRDSVRRIIGVDVQLGLPRGPGPHVLRRLNGQNTRQADRYRAGNVLLLGDSAHVHPPIGGPGLNLGLQDAMNLGWKLAAEVNGWAPEGLLDTYHRERHPVGQRVMMHSLSQLALTMPGRPTTALRSLIAELLQIPDAAEHLAHVLAGSDVRYDVGDDHRLAGQFMPELALEGGRRVANLLHSARPLLVDRTGGYSALTAHDWRDRVDVAVAGIGGHPASLLVRPDGYVAWAADTYEREDEQRLRDALQRWFGPPAPGKRPAA